MATHKVWPTEMKSLPEEPIETQQTEGSPKLKEQSPKTSYSCLFCQMTLNSYSEFKSHLGTHQEEKCYRCIKPNCGQMFKVSKQSF